MKVTVRDLTEQVEILAGRSGSGKVIVSPQIVSSEFVSQPVSRSIASHVLHLTTGQLDRLRGLPSAEAGKLIGALFKARPACIVVTGGRAPAELLRRAEKAHIAVLKTRSLPRFSKQLAGKFAPRITMHGVLVEIFGLGTLIIGESAIGKSESALDLVLRGHKLVADDLVVLEKRDGRITGRAVDMGADLLEIRGLGVINVRALYGDSATLAACTVGLVVELEEWKKGHYYSLLGLRERRHRLLSVNLPYLRLPIKPGRTMATLIEVAARNQLLKNRGIYTARELNRSLKRRLAG